jgi:hypothetical protein
MSIIGNAKSSVEVGPVAPADSVTLFKICDDLQMYYDTLEAIEAQLAEPQLDEEKAALEKGRAEMLAQIESVGTELVKKTDNIAGVLRRITSEQELIKSEEERLRARRKCFERAEKWLRTYVLSVMRQRGVSQLKTPTHTLFIRSTEAVSIIDAGAVSAIYKTVTVKMPLVVWQAILDRMHGPEGVRAQEEISLADIKREIKAGGSVDGADITFGDSLVIR